VSAGTAARGRFPSRRVGPSDGPFHARNGVLDVRRQRSASGLVPRRSAWLRRQGGASSATVGKPTSAGAEGHSSMPKGRSDIRMGHGGSASTGGGGPTRRRVRSAGGAASPGRGRPQVRRQGTPNLKPKASALVRTAQSAKPAKSTRKGASGWGTKSASSLRGVPGASKRGALSPGTGSLRPSSNRGALKGVRVAKVGRLLVPRPRPLAPAKSVLLRARPGARPVGRAAMLESRRARAQPLRMKSALGAVTHRARPGSPGTRSVPGGPRLGGRSVGTP
jgi:hypothetical protein